MTKGCVNLFGWTLLVLLAIIFVFIWSLVQVTGKYVEERERADNLEALVTFHQDKHDRLLEENWELRELIEGEK